VAFAPAGSAVSLVSTELRQLGLLTVATLVCLGLVTRVAWREQRHSALRALNSRLELAAVEWRMNADTLARAARSRRAVPGPRRCRGGCAQPGRARSSG